MQLIDMRYARIEGTEVVVQVTSAAEAKAAIRELRHKKKELGILKKRLLKEMKASRTAHAKAERERERQAKAKGVVASLRRVGRMLSGPEPIATRNPDEIAGEISKMDEICHNIDSCVVQLEGKLLTLN
jgi:hypothetical protein